MSSNYTVSIHGTLVNVFGVGVLIKGESGCGKSECALEIVARGHSLVADDAVIVSREGNELFGSSPAELFGLIEVRGLGICDIRRLFGKASVAEKSTIGVIIELHSEKAPDEIECLTGKQNKAEILGVTLPHFVIANSSVRSLPVIVETAARIINTGGKTAESDLIARYNKAAAA